MTTFETVREMARQLGAKVSVDAVRVDGKLVAWIPPRAVKDVEPGTMAVRMPIDRRDEMIAEDPKVYYITKHYLKAQAVLVRLPNIPADALKDLVRAAVLG